MKITLAGELLAKIENANLAYEGEKQANGLASAILNRPDFALEWAKAAQCEVPSEAWLRDNRATKLSEFAIAHRVQRDEPTA